MFHHFVIRLHGGETQEKVWFYIEALNSALKWLGTPLKALREVTKFLHFPRLIERRKYKPTITVHFLEKRGKRSIMWKKASCKAILLLLFALEIVGLRVPVRRTRDTPLFSVCSSSKNCPSARCVSAANVVCNAVDVFEPKTLSLKHILN
jgi:hypothetical protein